MSRPISGLRDSGAIRKQYILEITEYARPRFGLILVSIFASIGLIPDDGRRPAPDQRREYR